MTPKPKPIEINEAELVALIGVNARGALPLSFGGNRVFLQADLAAPEYIAKLNELREGK